MASSHQMILNNMKIIRLNIKEWSATLMNQLNLSVHSLNEKLLILKNNQDEKEMISELGAVNERSE